MRDFKKGDVYKDFYISNVIKDQMYEGYRRYALRHRTTGLEIFYMSNPIQQNLFSFSFRTPVFDDSGVFHILEHSVLNGSKKYPYSEAFNIMNRRVVNSYLNANTTPFCTNFIADSIIKSEALRLMDYLEDSIFFPLLKEEVFLQEGWRIEYDENNNPVFNGTVLNEMKEKFTSSHSISEKEVNRVTRMVPVLQNYAGGDPLVIPSLTYEKFLETYKKYYRPDNCLLQFWGVIPLDELLDYISENYIPGLEEKFNMHETIGNWKTSTYNISDEMLSLVKTVPLKEKSIKITEYGNEKESDNCLSFTYVWNLGKFEAENNLVANLFGELIDEKLRNSFEDIDYYISVNAGRYDANNNIIQTLEMGGVKPEFEKQVRERFALIMEDIKKNKVSQKIINRVKLFISSYKEVGKDPSAPSNLLGFSERWSSGKGLDNDVLFCVQNERKFKKAINKKKFLDNLLDKYFFGEEAEKPFYVESRYSYVPNEDYCEERKIKENELVQKIYEQLGEETVKSNIQKLKEFQEIESGEKTKECEKKVPVINLRDKVFPRFTADMEMKFMKNNVPCLEGLVDREMNENMVAFLFPLDNVSPERIKWLTVLERIYSIGCSENPFTLENSVNAKTSFCFYEDRLQEDEERLQKKYKNVCFLNRNFFSIIINCFPTEIENAFDIFRKKNFRKELKLSESEMKKIKEAKPVTDSFIERYQGAFILTRMLAENSQIRILDEMEQGYTGFKTLVEWNKTFSEEGFEQVQKILDELMSGGCMIEYRGLKKDKKRIEKEINRTIAQFGLTPLQSTKITDEESGQNTQSLYTNALIEQIEEKGKLLGEVIGKPQPVGECYVTIPLKSQISSREDLAEDIMCTWIETTIANEKLRNEHGCYSVNFTHDSKSGKAILMTTQDPDPEKSVEIIRSIVKEAAEHEWAKSDYEEIWLDHFTREAFHRTDITQVNETMDAIFNLYDNVVYRREEENYYSITTEDLHQAALRLYKNLDQMKVDMVKVKK